MSEPKELLKRHAPKPAEDEVEAAWAAFLDENRNSDRSDPKSRIRAAISALDAHRAKHAKPVAWLSKHGTILRLDASYIPDSAQPLYLHPPASPKGEANPTYANRRDGQPDPHATTVTAPAQAPECRCPTKFYPEQPCCSTSLSLDSASSTRSDRHWTACSAQALNLHMAEQLGGETAKLSALQAELKDTQTINLHLGTTAPMGEPRGYMVNGAPYSDEADAREAAKKLCATGRAAVCGVLVLYKLTEYRARAVTIVEEVKEEKP